MGLQRREMEVFDDLADVVDASFDASVGGGIDLDYDGGIAGIV